MKLDVKKATVFDYPIRIHEMGVASRTKVYSLGTSIVADIINFSTEPDIQVPATDFMLGLDNDDDDDDTDHVYYVSVTPKRFRAHTKGENPFNGFFLN